MSFQVGGFRARLGVLEETRLLVEVFAGAILANFVTGTLVYNLWKLTKNERDLKAIAICIACFGAVILSALALRS